MGRDRVTQATQVSRREAERNARLVLAEGALVGERRVAIARVVMIAFFSVGLEVSARVLGEKVAVDPLRITVGASYTVLAIALLVYLRRRAPSLRAVTYEPLVVSVVDFAFISFMGVRNYQVEGVIRPEMGIVGLAVLVCFSVARFSWIHVAFSTVLACASYVAVTAYTDALEPIAPFVVGGLLTLGFVIGITNHAVRRMFDDLRRRDNLSRFLPPAVVERILAHGEHALAPVQREITILFADIRGFTRLSEKLAPRDLLAFLDDYLGRMTVVIKGHDGVVNKFLGDGVLAFWGAPDPDPQHARRAVEAARDMLRVVSELNADRERDGLPAIRIGIGIHTGAVAAGMLGGAEQHEYTVIGDAVNVASRIEALTKDHETDILLTEATRRAAGAGLETQRIAEVDIRGREEPIVVHSVA